MKNEDAIKAIKDIINERTELCVEHGKSISSIQDDIQEIKIEIAKITTAYKVFIAIGSAIGVIVGFLVELFYKSI